MVAHYSLSLSITGDISFHTQKCGFYMYGQSTIARYGLLPAIVQLRGSNMLTASRRGNTLGDSLRLVVSFITYSYRCILHIR